MRKLLLPLLLLLTVSTASAFQFAYPTSDVTDGSWSTTSTAAACSATDCTTEIDEGEATPTATGTESQADWVESSSGTTGTDTYETAINCSGGCSEPSSTAAILRFSDYLAESGGGAGSSCTLGIAIYEGANLRHTCSSTSPTKNAWTARTCDTTGGWSNSTPTDWTALSVRFTWNMSSGGKSCSTRVSWVELQIADAAGGARRRIL